ncbi:M20/M25/M40 family metallo-hydrolase [Rathayibacter sp. VKM Ac-2760]|uniref:M20/M25/M40 family metallo-hydrolase n=1 Tax=Rathayibacter sp. VKM Ac-2760 TaxID=2609253 RepID=UPI0013192680|nr:M20/M25/M40 family metallo-hydrolase [Rathayibacter sp. VKM Ac-2760]QHC61195.1 M20/M25/M40 family metallo-hydrolase [Rathayibacter sp. VKM Ac-2760]
MTDAAETGRRRLRTLVETESPTGHREGIATCLDLIDSWASPALGRLGERRTVDGVDHLYWPAAGTPTVLLLAHVDTVWPINTIAERPYLEQAGRAIGPGTFDMKAGIVAAIGALEQLADTGHVSLLVTSDEEKGSLTSRALVEEAAGLVDAVLVPEPSLDGALKIARRGGSIYRIVFEGVAAHAGLEPELGANALIELAHQVLAVGRAADAGCGTTVSATVARAGTVVNTVPADAELHLDVRAWTTSELERVHRQLSALDAVDPRVTVTVHGGINRPPLEQERALGLLGLAKRVAEREGLPPVEGVPVGGASDGNFTGALGIATLDGLGPLGAGAHAPHEWVDLASMHERTQLLAGLLRELAPPTTPARPVPVPTAGTPDHRTTAAPLEERQ